MKTAPHDPLIDRWLAHSSRFRSLYQPKHRSTFPDFLIISQPVDSRFLGASELVSNSRSSALIYSQSAGRASKGYPRECGNALRSLRSSGRRCVNPQSGARSSPQPLWCGVPRYGIDAQLPNWWQSIIRQPARSDRNEQSIPDRAAGHFAPHKSDHLTDPGAQLHNWSNRALRCPQPGWLRGEPARSCLGRDNLRDNGWKPRQTLARRCHSMQCRRAKCHPRRSTSSRWHCPCEHARLLD